MIFQRRKFYPRVKGMESGDSWNNFNTPYAQSWEAQLAARRQALETYRQGLLQDADVNPTSLLNVPIRAFQPAAYRDLERLLAEKRIVSFAVGPIHFERSQDDQAMLLFQTPDGNYYYTWGVYDPLTGEIHENYRGQMLNLLLLVSHLRRMLDHLPINQVNQFR
jgi:hypothetical protein